MRVETKTEIQTKEVTFNIYVADDGKEFDDAKQCEQYEYDMSRVELRQKLNNIQTCKDMDGYTPVDGGEYHEIHDFRWYLPKTKAHADIISEFYGLEYGISDDEIGDWVCVEVYDIDDPAENAYVISIKNSIDYIQKLFSALGYDVSIVKHKED